jgi:hypothetical protein
MVLMISTNAKGIWIVKSANKKLGREYKKVSLRWCKKYSKVKELGRKHIMFFSAILSKAVPEHKEKKGRKKNRFGENL